MDVQAVNRMFDALILLETVEQQAGEERRLTAEVLAVGTTCGDCRLWMTRACPEESNVNGWNRGPSCATSRCATFEESESAMRRRERLTGELAASQARGKY